MASFGCSPGVYGPLSREGRYSFWEELGAIRGLWENSWCIGGDFNVIQFLAKGICWEG